MAVEFTRHSGDEMYRGCRGLGVEWTPAEAQQSAPVSERNVN
jgi:hypothetical protein